MKKIYVGLIILMFLFEIPVFSQDIEGVTDFIDDPEDIARWFSKEFEYHWTIPDEPQSADEILESKTGDCDDFAVLASEILVRLGKPNFIAVIKFKGLKVEHAICIWKEDAGNYNFLSNHRLHKTNEKHIIKAIDRFYPDWEAVTFVNRSRKPLAVFTHKGTKKSPASVYDYPFDKVCMR